jgi:dCTP diphosphatase
MRTRQGILSSMSQFQDLKKAVNAFRDARDWRQFHTPKDLALSMSLEAAEVLEHFQWKDDAKVKKYLTEGGKEDLQKEIADVLIYMIMLADDTGIDLYTAVKQKLAEQEQKYPVEKAKGTSKKYSKL